MLKHSYLLFLSGLLSLTSYGQPSCEKLIKLIQASKTNQSYWDSTDYSLDNFYCAGSYFAQQDIEKGIYLIQTYNNPEWDHPCKICKYKSHGYSFNYNKGTQLDTRTSFIEGYNEFSEGYLRSKLTDSVFAHLSDIPKTYFSPGEILSSNFDNGSYRKLLDIEVISDASINVKLLVDAVFRDYPQFLPKIVYRISEFNPQDKTSGLEQTYDYKQITKRGIRLTKKVNGNYYFKIVFDFKNIPVEEKYCWCSPMNEKEYSYVIPLIFK